MPPITNGLERVTRARFGEREGYLLSRDECEAIAKRIMSLATAPYINVRISCNLGGMTKFSRGQVDQSAEYASADVSLVLRDKDRQASLSTTQLDDAGLKQLVAEAEKVSREWRGDPVTPKLLGSQVYPESAKIWFDETIAMMTSDERQKVTRKALESTEAAGVIGAGTFQVSSSSEAIINSAGLFAYQKDTYSALAVTARTKDGQGSGWGRGGYEDWRRVNPADVIHRAIDLAQRTQNHVAIEPGRYTVILEPTAVASLVDRISWSAFYADAGMTAFSKQPRGSNKIGLKMLDERLGFEANPWDSEAPRAPIGQDGEPLEKVVYFVDGVLRELAYDPEYAAQKNRAPNFPPLSVLRLTYSGQPQSLDEMIATTKRGIWVNRLSNVSTMNRQTNLLTGTTRDGAFLIENGKITKAIKNLRFTESPFFVLNKLEAAGVPVRASYAIVAPRVKVRDFDFTSLTDAV